MRKRFSVLICLFVFIFAFFLVCAFEAAEKKGFQEKLRSQTTTELSQLRANLEKAINEDFYLTRGLIAFVSTYPNINHEMFSRWSRNLLHHRNRIINIGLAPNNILSFVYPLEGNRKALGLNYEKNAKQWPAVKESIDSGKTVVAGPVNLVQGGAAFISRTPIYIESDQDRGKGAYWGLASIVISKEQLFSEAGLYDSNRRIQVAIKGRDGKGAKGELIEGSEDIFTTDPVILDVQLPEGSWQLAAIPLAGWLQPSPNIIWIRSLGVGSAVFINLFVLLWSYRINRNHSSLEQARQKAEEASKTLAKSEGFLNTILENIPHMIFVKDAETLEFIHFNKAGEELTGFARQDLLGKKIESAQPDAVSSLMTEQDQKVLDEKKPIAFQNVTISTAQHGERTFNIKKIPLLNLDHQPEFILGIGEDITEQLAAEKEKQELENKLNQALKMEAIGLMAGGVAHDLNNILAAITGYPELMLRKLPAESDFRKPLEVILDSGTRAVAIVSDLLTVAKGAASERNPTDLNPLIREYLNSPEFQSTMKYFTNGEVKTQLDEHLHKVSASSVHIKKCLMNLVNNAVEAMRGEGLISISTWNEVISYKSRSGHGLVAGEYVVLSVKDDGPGISQKDLEHIFEPFYTKKAMGKRGTGLGLAVVWNTIKSHKGEIFVDSSSQGTTFSLYFPVCHATQLGFSELENEAFIGGQGQKILVVDDEPHMRDIACEILKEAGYQAESVGSGEEALKYIAHTAVDLVLLDMFMEPGISGFETYQKIISINPTQKALIASGYSESVDVKRALELGVARFISKPYSFNQLCSVVKDILA